MGGLLEEFGQGGGGRLREGANGTHFSSSRVLGLQRACSEPSQTSD